MADVTWIKMMVDMFDGMSFKRIKRARIGGEKFRDKLTSVWFELMALAGRCNHDGAFIDQSGIVLSELDDIATQIDREEDELNLCMTFYLKEGMVTHDNGVYSIANWSEYQNTDRLQEIREYNRIAKQKSRAKHKALQAPSDDVNDKSMTSQPCQGIEEERDEDKDKDIDIKNERKNESSFAQPTHIENDDFSTEFSTGEDKIRKTLGGELGQGVVLLSQEQMDDLLEKLSLEEFDHYVRVVADCIKKGKPFTRKTHYQAILDMANKDRKIM
jgi:hypothetical protein